jgi:nicotinamide mononucleotide (NMN) deamidase PncC
MYFPCGIWEEHTAGTVFLCFGEEEKREREREREGERERIRERRNKQ